MILKMAMIRIIHIIAIMCIMAIMHIISIISIISDCFLVGWLESFGFRVVCTSLTTKSLSFTSFPFRVSWASFPWCPYVTPVVVLEKFRVKCQAEVTLFRVGRMHSAAA
jgi:hypothetical protein